MSIPNYLSEVYSEELFNHSEDDERALAEILAAESEQWQGYGEWSAAMESENFTVTADGKLKHKPEPPSIGRIGSFEL